MIKFHAFRIYLAIPYMVVRVSGVTLVVSPTYTNFERLFNNYDIILSGDVLTCLPALSNQV